MLEDNNIKSREVCSGMIAIEKTPTHFSQPANVQSYLADLQFKIEAMQLLIAKHSAPKAHRSKDRDVS